MASVPRTILYGRTDVVLHPTPGGRGSPPLRWASASHPRCTNPSVTALRAVTAPLSGEPRGGRSLLPLRNCLPRCRNSRFAPARKGRRSRRPAFAGLRGLHQTQPFGAAGGARVFHGAPTSRPSPHVSYPAPTARTPFVRRREARAPLTCKKDRSADRSFLCGEAPQAFRGVFKSPRCRRSSGGGGRRGCWRRR